ncbi:MAG TPA: aldo/keto reductase, partial [Armatimonadota bacterium]|nr:aldo/keto reductase [Armatimonadota bacterium]
IHLGMGTMVWSPLAGGLLSGKYRPSEGGEQGEGRLQAMKGTSNPAFAKFSERNWEIVAALEHAAKELDRSMAQVAVNWVANRPGVATVILGATKPHQLEDNLKALEFTIPPPLLEALDAASAPPPRYPYTFFTPEMQAMLTGGLPVGSKAPGYAPPVLTDAPPAGTASE